MSAKLTPAAATRIRTSPWPGLGTGAPVIKRMSCGPFNEVCCRARMVAGMLTAISPSSACLIAAGLFGEPHTVDQVDLRHPNKESATAEASEPHQPGPFGQALV